MRSYLFVPADSRKKLDKGLTSGADALIVDLEDSVSPEQKQAARETARAFLEHATAQPKRPWLILRVNALSTGLTDLDLDGVMAGRPDAVMLPKAEGGPCVVHLDAKLAVREAQHGIPDGQVKIVAIATETGASLFGGGTYRGASARLAGLTWGAEDLSADLGAETNRDDAGVYLDPYRLARTLCLAAAAAANVPAIDAVYTDFRDDAGLRREAEAGRRDGFTGKLAIHPNQIASINAVFTPDAQAIAKAKALIDMFAANPALGVIAIDGVMYDRPHIARAERLLARAKAAGMV